MKSTECSKTDEQSRIDQLEHEKYMVEIQVSGLKEAIEAAHNDLEDAGVEKRTLEKQVDLIYHKQSHNIFTCELEEFHYFNPSAKLSHVFMITSSNSIAEGSRRSQHAMFSIAT